jgi:hypothetical protein
MALITGHGEVRSEKRVGRLRVVLGAEAGGAETVDVVAALASPPVGPLRELAGVGVGVAVGASVVLEPQGAAGRVALPAPHAGVAPG